MTTTAHAPKSFFRGRNYALGAQLDTFLVCAATGVIVNRVVLIILGYPQIGGRQPGAIHISHSIYGGFMLLVAIAVALSFLHPNVRWFVAIAGGLGFGWYIDELGKYVSNAGYLYQPALALIYVVFVVMYLAFTRVASRGFGPDDAVANALESLQAAALGTLDQRQREVALVELDRRGPDTRFAAQVRALLADAPASPPRPPNVFRRTGARLASLYTAWTHRKSFTVVIMVFFALLAISVLGSTLGLSLDGPGITEPSERVASIAATVAGVLVVIGMYRLRESRLAAYRWFDRALLIWILVVRVYMFDQGQFEAVVGLAIDLFVWVMIRSAITIESQREDRELLARASAAAHAEPARP